MLGGLVLLLVAGLISAVPAAGATTLELRADVLTVDTVRRVIEARGRVRLTDGRSVARADHAVYALRDRRVTLSGAVSIADPDGSLQSRQAVLYLTSGRTIERIDASGDVEVEARERVLRADEVTYTVAARALTARGHVQYFTPPDIIMSGDDLIIKGRDVAVLKGHARVQNRDGFVSGDRLEMDEKAQTAYLRGHVLGVFQETRITSDAATLVAREKKAIFRDRVTIVRPGRTMSADVVTFFYQQNRMIAEGETRIRIEDEQGP